MFKLIGSLVVLMLSNILLDISLVHLKLEFNKEKFYKNVLKIIYSSIAIILMYLSTYLSPNIMVIEINGISMNLRNGMGVIFTAGIVLYAYKCLKKLGKLLKVNDIAEVNNCESNKKGENN